MTARAVIDDEADMAALDARRRCRSGTSVRLMNWSPMSMKALRSPLPRKVKSKIRPYHSSASSMSPTSIATWLMPMSRGFFSFHPCSDPISARICRVAPRGRSPRDFGLHDALLAMTVH